MFVVSLVVVNRRFMESLWREEYFDMFFWYEFGEIELLKKKN